MGNLVAWPRAAYDVDEVECKRVSETVAWPEPPRRKKPSLWRRALALLRLEVAGRDDLARKDRASEPLSSNGRVRCSGSSHCARARRSTRGTRRTAATTAWCESRVLYVLCGSSSLRSSRFVFRVSRFAFRVVVVVVRVLCGSRRAIRVLRVSRFFVCCRFRGSRFAFRVVVIVAPGPSRRRAAVACARDVAARRFHGETRARR